MKNAIKRNIVFLVVAIFVVTSVVPGLSTADSLKISLQNDSTCLTNNVKIVVENYDDVVMINYKIDKFTMKDLNVDGRTYTKIFLDDESHLMIKGEPDLPNICRSIKIPDNKKIDIHVIDAQYEEYENILIAPSKGVLTRDVSYDEVPYEFSTSYNKDEFSPSIIAELGTPYIIRDLRGQVVTINLFQYNPIQKTLRFYTDITVEVYPKGLGGENCISNSEPPSALDSDFKEIYEKHFINFDSSLYTPVEEQGNMIVITYDDFWNAMIPFVQWKNMKGIPTEMTKVSEIGNADAIKNYISDYYNDNGLTFVLLVGDAQQVPSLHASGGASDPSYSYVVGNDHYPDLFVGRFSAQNLGHVETQVERSIEYERNPQAGADWYHKGTGIASNQGPGDDGEYDDEHIDYIRDDLLGYTYTIVDQIYDPYGTASQVTNALEEGRSIINYCGHGWAQGWGSTGFSNTDINALTNDNMLPFIWSVACNNGEFDSYNACFAEAWLRATHNDEPTGAIAAFMSSVGQSWNPPMDAQDEFNDLLVGNEKNTFGGLSFNGCMHMNDEYGGSGWAMTDTWNLFGDPSIQVRTDTPESLTVTHEPSMPMGSLTFEVDVEGVEGALCAISRDYELFGYGYTNSSGHAVIEFFNLMPPCDDLDLVVTACNMIPYFGVLSVEGEDDPPEKPQKPEGTRHGFSGENYSHSSITNDPDGDPIYYMWDWGDGNFSEWIGPYESRLTCIETYTWFEKGGYSIRVKAKDIYGLESDWSDPLDIIMSHGKIVVLILNFLEKYFPGLYSRIIDLIT